MANVRILWVPKNDVVYLEHSTADDINQGGGELRAAAPSFCPAGPTSTTIEPPRTIEHAPIGKPNIQPGAPLLAHTEGSRIVPGAAHGRRGKATGIVNSRRLRPHPGLALLARRRAHHQVRLGLYARASSQGLDAPQD